MNSLSWTIYLAQMVVNLGVVAMWICLFGGISTVMISLFSAAENGKPFPWAVKTFIWIMAVTIPILVFIPSQKTVMMIAASQYGEMVAKSPQVAQIVDPSLEFLKNYIESETAKLKNSKSK
jgi:hypothetical protein